MRDTLLSRLSLFLLDARQQILTGRSDLTDAAFMVWFVIIYEVLNSWTFPVSAFQMMGLEIWATSPPEKSP